MQAGVHWFPPFIGFLHLCIVALNRYTKFLRRQAGRPSTRFAEGIQQGADAQSGAATIGDVASDGVVKPRAIIVPG
jgi:hypothetical protein